MTAEGTRLCVEGLKHGERYTITARAGPSRRGRRQLAKDCELRILCEGPQPLGALRRQAAIVLPRTGQNGIPLISVNSKEAKLALYRIGDRNLIASVVNSDFRAADQRL